MDRRDARTGVFRLRRQLSRRCEVRSDRRRRGLARHSSGGVGAAKTMISRTEERFGLKPERLAADTAYGSAATLHWIVNEKKITPHIPVIDKSKREDGSLSRADFTFDKDRNVYMCPNGKLLHTTGRIHDEVTVLYRVAARLLEGFRVSECAGGIASALVDAARDFALWRAFGQHLGLSGQGPQSWVLGDNRSRRTSGHHRLRSS